jgi:hypothetical protein
MACETVIVPHDAHEKINSAFMSEREYHAGVVARATTSSMLLPMKAIDGPFYSKIIVPQITANKNHPNFTQISHCVQLNSTSIR